MKNKSFLNRLGIFLGGVFATKISAYTFDYLLYPFTIYHLGLKWGFVVMLILSFGINYFLIFLYDKTKVDIFGFEKLKDLKDKTSKDKTSLLAKLASTGYVITFIVLSFYDPFFATLWFRKSTKFDGMTRRDWRILTLSTVIGNLLWAPAVFGALKLINV